MNNTNIKYFFSYKLLFIGLVFSLSVVIAACAQSPGHLLRSLETLQEETIEISSETAVYKPMFGMGDKDATSITGIERFGYLTIEPEGNSRSVSYDREELIYYVLGGTGVLDYEDQRIPIGRHDYFYIPIGTEHKISNPRESSLNMIVMGFSIPWNTQIAPTAGLEIANINDVPREILGSHGPTVTYQLLLGTTESERHRLASAYQVTGLFIMNFKPDGTNIPHRHRNAEEIYFMLQGEGEMVAGETAEGEPRRYPAEAGDAFFYSRNELVGFYSESDEGVERARILAVRTVNLRE